MNLCLRYRVYDGVELMISDRLSWLASVIAIALAFCGIVLTIEGQGFAFHVLGLSAVVAVFFIWLSPWLATRKISVVSVVLGAWLIFVT